MEYIENYVVYGIKVLYMCLCMIYIYGRLINLKIEHKKNYIIVLFMVILIDCICIVIMKNYSESFYSNLFLYFSVSFVLSLVFKQNKSSVMIGCILSFAIYYIIFAVAVLISFFIENCIHFKSRTLSLIIIILVHEVLVYFFFNIKRFKNGLKFLKNDSKNEYLDIMILSISSIVTLMFSLVSYNVKITNSDMLEYNGRNITKYLFLYSIIFGVIMIIMIQKTLTLSYKQKLLENTLKDYEDKIKEKDLIIENLSEEKFKISKLNHEFYNRQRSLEMKVETALSNMNYEIGEEINLKDKIEELSKEYINKVKENKIRNELSKTDIEEIDDMFKYMQSECIKNGIEFILQINGNIHYLINNIIDKTKLVTLIGDHLRDAIIAISYSDIEYKSILAILGIKENCYEFCIYDSGIEFEIETFKKLGLEPATTHKDNGGTGIGFITTFETLKEAKASLIIEEKNKVMENNYTKAVKFRFDNKNEFIIISYRASEIKENIRDDRILIQEFLHK